MPADNPAPPADPERARLAQTIRRADRPYDPDQRPATEFDQEAIRRGLLASGRYEMF